MNQRQRLRRRKMNMGLFKRKPKFIFEFSGTEHFQSKDILDPNDLVRHMIDEDNRFRRDYLEGFVVITKVKNTINGQVYYSKKFELPQEEGFRWVDALASFFTKKPLPYDVERETVFSTKATKEHESTNNEPLTLESFEESLTVKAEKQAIAATNDEMKMDSEPTKKVKEEAIQEAPSTDMVQLSQSELTALQTAIKEQKDELRVLQEQLNQKKEPKVAIEKEVLETPAEATDTYSFVSPVGTVVSTTIQEEGIPDLLEATKNELDHALSSFIQTETDKINKELVELDKRSMIEEQFTKISKNEEQQQLEKLKNQLNTENQVLIQQEIQRHEQELAEISAAMDSKYQNETKVIKEACKKKLTVSIQEEYERQTDQLTSILQGKMDELQLRQQALNNGLKENFQQTLEQFNQKHGQVIAGVAKKKQAAPIDLEERRQQKHA